MNRRLFLFSTVSALGVSTTVNATIPLLGAGGKSGGSTSAINALTVVSDTPLLDQTNDYGDATARIGVNGNGWVCKVTVPYIPGATFDPTKIIPTAVDPGYDGSGSTTVTRTLAGTAILRRQYNAASSLQQSNDGVTLTVYFALNDHIYSGTTISGVQALAGFYGASAAGSVSSITNSSTRAYEKPLWGWMNTQQERATGSGFTVEGAAYHRRMQQGRQVARVEFIATDHLGAVAATQTASAPALSSFQTQGQIAEVYKASVPLTGLANAGVSANIATVNAKVYPWLGDSSAVLDLSAAISWPTAKPQTLLRFINDKNGTYGGANAAVQIGAIGGTVQSTYALALTTPFPTMQAAAAALSAYNNANKGHNDHCGATIWMMETVSGLGATHTLGTFSGATVPAAGGCWTEVRIDPAATGTVTAQLTASVTVSGLFRWFIPIAQTGNFLMDGNAANGNVMQAYEAAINTGTSSVPINYQQGLCYLRNVTLTGTGAKPLGGFSTTRTQQPLMLGVIDLSSTSDYQVEPFVMIGCHTVKGFFHENTAADRDSHDLMVMANNKLMKLGDTASLWGTIAYTGLAIVQNVFERASASSAAPCISLMEDATTLTVANLVLAYNSVPGKDTSARFNMFYADTAGTAGVIKEGGRRFNLYYQFNSKRDTFTSLTTVTGRVGTWKNAYAVGAVGEVSITGSATGTAPAIDGSTWLGEVWQGTPNAGAGNVTWTSNLSGVGGAGDGDYSLTGGANAAYSAVPAGSAGLAFDIAGIARKNDGSGAAGAYERTV